MTYTGFSSSTGNVDTRLFDMDLVKQDLINHLNIRKGEVRGFPRFGTRIYDMIGQPLTNINKQIIENDVRDVINYDPRVELRQIIVESDTNSISVRARLFYVEFGVEDLFEYYIESTRA